MQNFTFGRKGHNWFLFAFILFVGSLSSYGQCATVNDEDSGTAGNQQSYCYLETIQDLIDDGVITGTDVEIYETADRVNDTDPYNREELLTNGTTYYVGSSSDSSCSRVPVMVTVNAGPKPTNTVTNSQEGFTITPCESSEFSGNDLLGLFNSDADYTLKIYENQFGDSEISDYDAPLTDGESYFVGNTPDNSSDCPSRRVAVGIDVVQSPKPTAENPQFLCEGATVGDLKASSSEPDFQAFRWYRSATSSTPLADDVQLIDGEDYFVSQIVNERNSIFPPCESERTSVVVTIITFDAGPDIGLTLCQKDLESRLNSGESPTEVFLSLVDDRDLPSQVSFNPSIQSITQSYASNPTQTFSTIATFTTPEGCEDDVDLSLTVVEDPDAGEDGNAELSSDDGTVNLIDYLNGDPDTGGNWDKGDGTFTVGTDTPGEYTYIVDNGLCEDRATVTVTVNECTPPNAGSDNIGVICEQDVQATFQNNRGKVKQYYLSLLSAGVPKDGTFNPTINQIIDRYRNDADGLGDFSTTYTIGEDDCTDSVTLTARIAEETPANAGDFEDIENVCSDEDKIDLESLDNNDPDANSGGVFTGEGVSDNEFDPSIGAGTYTITYTVSDTAPCTTGSASTTFTIEVIENAVDGSINEELCIIEAQDLITDFDAASAYILTLLNTAGITDVDPNGFDLADAAEGQRLVDYINSANNGDETFNFSYFSPSTSLCETGTVNISITITNQKEANAGTIDDQRVCESEGMIDLEDFYGENTVPGGTFSGPGVTDNMFDSTIGPNTNGYEITYSVDDSAECVEEGSSDSTTFIITVDASVNAGTPNSAEVCRLDVDDMFPNTTAVRNFYLNLLDAGVARTGTFNPTIQQLINQYNSNPEQSEFTTEYSLTNGSCRSSVSLTINVFDAIPAEIDEIDDPDPICQNADDVNLFDFLADDANTNGRFEGYENGIFSPSSLDPGSYTITYVLDDSSECTEGEASEDFTITVTESAYAGQDKTIPETCKNSAEIDLSVYTSDGDAGGEYTFQSTGDIITGGLLDPSALTAGDYVIIYTVAAINDCGEDTAELAITISDAPDAPTVENAPFSFCATDDANAANLTATGSNLTFYSDAELTMMVMADEILMTGTYYVTQRLDENSCESDATAFSVVIGDAPTPTVSNTTLEFCAFDDPTVADLTAEINETGTITWYDTTDGDNSLAEGTPLQDGVTYYATLLDDSTGCESSVRLGVEVNIGGPNCELFIPEGFSPNGDNINDRFEPRNIRNLYPNYTIEIRNRFGDVVFKGNANSPDWDGYSTEGSLGSDLLPVGAYFYYINFNDGITAPRRGTVYLSR